MYGRIFTDQYASSQNTDEESDYDTDDDVLEIQRWVPIRRGMQVRFFLF